MTQSILNMRTPLHRHLLFFNSKAANARPHCGASRNIQNPTMEIKVGTNAAVSKQKLQLRHLVKGWKLLLSNSENSEHLKIFRNVDCVLAKHN